MLTDYYQAGQTDVRMVSIASKQSAGAVTGYINYPDPPVQFPVVIDTTQEAVWAQYEAGKDDIFVIDRFGFISHDFSGSMKLNVSKTPAQNKLKAAIAEALAQ